MISFYYLYRFKMVFKFFFYLLVFMSNLEISILVSGFVVILGFDFIE